MRVLHRLIAPLAFVLLGGACVTEPNGNGRERERPPTAPSELGAVAGDAQVTLSWTASERATGYRVKRAGVAGGPYERIGTSSASPYIDTGLANGTTYFYVVTAVNEVGESGLSDEVATTPSATSSDNLPPTVLFEVEPSTGTLPLEVQVDASGSTDADGSIASVAVDFGDGATLDVASGSHTFTSAGVFAVVATVTDDDGAVARATVNVAVAGSSGGPVNPILVASRTSGYAPLAVHFDATGTFSTTPGIGDAAQGGAFRQITHAFNFGDPDSGTHSISGLSRNLEPYGGGLAAHVFRTPGTYTVTVTSTDGVAPAASATVTITVDDPATLPTFAISRTGDFTDAPAGATQLTQTTLPTFASNSRYFFRRGEDWTGTTLEIRDPQTNVHIDAFGAGDNPIFDKVNVGTARPSSANFASDIRVSNITVRGAFFQENGNRVLFDHCEARGGQSGSGLGYSAVDPYRAIEQSAFVNSEEVFFVDCRLVGDGTPQQYLYYGNGSRLSFLNTFFGGTAQGTVRVVGWERGVMRHCQVESPYANSSVHALKLHSGGASPYATNWLASGGRNPVTSNYVNWTTSKIVIANTIFGGGNGGAANAAWTVAVCPQNDDFGSQGVEPLEDIILENNSFVRPPAGALDLAWGGRRLTSRGNTVAQGGALRVGSGHDMVAEYDGPYFSQ